MKYHLWTEGCQMNEADSARVASALERQGYEPVTRPELADVIILNTCVVRQAAEDKAYGRLSALKPLKIENPALVISVMGCLVGVRENPLLRKRFPFVDVFSPPSDPAPLLAYLAERDGRNMEMDQTSQRFAWMDEDLPLPQSQAGKTVSAFIPIVLGCSHACTYCVIPYRRGGEYSRPAEEILHEAESLAASGVCEITLLGQIVDRYGKDQPGLPNLSDLLKMLHPIAGITRIRFLTSHPNWMTLELMDTVAELPKVMPHIEVPVQAGDDTILAAMKRGHTAAQYRDLIETLRERIPGVSIATDIIVGFPGETEQMYKSTYDLLAELRLDVVHLARYSPRPGTVAERRMVDDVPASEKMRRFRELEELQESIALEIHTRHLGQTVDVLFEDKVRGRWRGRTPTNKLVFVETERNLRGIIAKVNITHAGAWSMNGQLVQ